MRQEDIWDDQRAQQYDTADSGMFAPEVLGPAVDRLAELAGRGRALEFAIGTGRVAIPLTGRGVPVTGIELSSPMIEQLRTKAGQEAIPVIAGDIATTRPPPHDHGARGRDGCLWRMGLPGWCSAGGCGAGDEIVRDRGRPPGGYGSSISSMIVPPSFRSMSSMPVGPAPPSAGPASSGHSSSRSGAAGPPGEEVLPADRGSGGEDGLPVVAPPAPDLPPWP